MNTTYNDAIDNPDNWSTMSDRKEPVTGTHAERTAQALTKAMDRFSESCKSCGGTGSFRSYTGRLVGQCFKCKGAGKLEFKTSTASREKARTSTIARKKRQQDDAIETFQTSHPELWKWMDGSTFPFAVSLREALYKYHDLTERQTDAAYRCVAKRDESKAAAIARVESAPTVDLNAINEAFGKASDHLKKPRLRIGNFVISKAPDSGKNAGALYVKEKVGTSPDDYDAGEFNDYKYRGKIVNGHFVRVRETTDEKQAEILALLADPKGAAISYGRVTGICACCGRQLIVKESIERGIGPICAERWGF